MKKSKGKRKHMSAAAAAALLLGSASTIAAVGEHDMERTDPAASYEQQQQHDQMEQRSQTGQQSQQGQAQAREEQAEAREEQAKAREEQAQTREEQGQTDSQQYEQTTAKSDTAASDAVQQLEQLAEKHGNLSTFFKAVEGAGLAEALVGSTEYTIFAPTDEAFEKSNRNVDELMQSENREELIALLRAHIVADDVDTEMARTIGQARTIDGGTIDLQADPEQENRFQVGQASVVEDDVQENNLRIYPIDQVLQPSEFAAFEPSATDEQSSSEEMQRETDTRANTGTTTTTRTQTEPEEDSDIDVDVDVDRDTQEDNDW